MLTLDSNSTLTIDQQLHCLTGDIIYGPNSTELSLCKELTTGEFNHSASFRFTPSEGTAIHKKLLEIKKLSHSQPESTETSTVLLTYLLLIVSRSKNPHPLLGYAKQIAITQKHLDFANIGAALRHLSKIAKSEDTQSIFTILLDCLVSNKKNQQVMTLAEVSTAFFGLESADFSDPTIQQIVDELTWHTNQNTQKLSRSQLAQSFFGLRNMQLNPHTENALRALFPHLQHLIQTKNWFDGRQLETLSKVAKNIPVDHGIVSMISTEITQHIEGNAAGMNWLESTVIESVLQNLDHLKTHADSFLSLTALFPHIQHTDKEYPLTFTGIELILSILGTPPGILFAENILPALLGHLDSRYMEKSEEDFRSWLDHVLSPFSQYPTQSEIISAFRQKALAISEPENSKEDSLFDDPNSDSPRTLTTGSDSSLSEEETHQVDSSHSIHSDHNNGVNTESPLKTQ